MEILIIKNNETVMDWNSPSFKNSIEKIGTKINNNPRLRKCFIVLMGTMMMSQKAMAATKPDPLDMIDVTGALFLQVVMRVGYRLILICCAIEIIKSMMQGDTKSIAKILMKYLCATMALYSFPWLVDLVVSACAR